jgi:uncharacterized FAD-dependent dehydrogenase
LADSNAGGTKQGVAESNVQAGLTTSTQEAKPGRGLRIAGAVTFGVGVAGVAAGLTLALAANRLADELEASATSYQRSKEHTRATYATASTVSYAAGGACIAGGAILYYLGWKQGRDYSATVEPMAGFKTAGARLTVAF